MAEILNGGKQPLQRAYLGSNKIYDKDVEDKAKKLDSYLPVGTYLGFRSTPGTNSQQGYPISLTSNEIKTDWSNVRGLAVYISQGAQHCMVLIDCSKLKSYSSVTPFQSEEVKRFGNRGAGTFGGSPDGGFYIQYSSSNTPQLVVQAGSAEDIWVYSI